MAKKHQQPHKGVRAGKIDRGKGKNRPDKLIILRKRRSQSWLTGSFKTEKAKKLGTTPENPKRRADVNFFEQSSK
jgi:hypothetical protein